MLLIKKNHSVTDTELRWQEWEGVAAHEGLLGRGLVKFELEARGVNYFQILTMQAHRMGLNPNMMTKLGNKFRTHYTRNILYNMCTIGSESENDQRLGVNEKNVY